MTESSSLTSWFFLSIYYAPDRWNLLCKEAILPFVEEHGTKLCQKYILHFGSMRGHYLGLSCKLAWEERAEFLQLFHEYFSNFLCKNRSASTPTPAPSGLYMDFPPNVICHSVHNFMPTFHAPWDEDYTKLWQDSSRCLLKAIKRDHLHTDDLFTAALYLNLMLLLFDGDLSNEYLRKCSAEFEHNSGAKAEHAILFSRAESELNEILHNARSRSYHPKKEYLATIYEWFDFFQGFSLKAGYSEGQSRESRYELFIDMLFTIRKQLGIGNQTLIDYFLYKLLTTK